MKLANWIRPGMAIEIGAAALLLVGITTEFISQGRGDTPSQTAATSTPTTPAAVGGDSTNGSSPVVQPSPASPQTNPAMTADQIIKKTKETYAALSSYSDSGTVSSQMGTFTTTTNFKILLQRPGFYRIDWQGMSNGVVWSDGTGDYLQYSGLKLQKEQNREMALAAATGISSGAAASIPGTFFVSNWGGKLGGEHQRQNDETVGGILCYVLSGMLKANGNNLSTTLWIGQEDNLLHQIKTTMEGLPKMPEISDSSLKTVLASENKPATPEAMEALRKQLSAAQELAKTMLKSGKVEFDESHTNIAINKTFVPADFKPVTN